MQQIYRRTPMPKCDFNKVALQLYWHGTSVWVLLNDYHIFLISPLVFTDCYSMRFITLSSYISLINDVKLIFVYLFDDLILGFCYSNLTRESGEFKFTSTITLVLLVNVLTKCAIHISSIVCQSYIIIARFHISYFFNSTAVRLGDYKKTWRKGCRFFIILKYYIKCNIAQWFYSSLIRSSSGWY